MGAEAYSGLILFLYVHDLVVIVKMVDVDLMKQISCF